jgi:hypothetical protein
MIQPARRWQLETNFSEEKARRRTGTSPVRRLMDFNQLFLTAVAIAAHVVAIKAAMIKPHEPARPVVTATISPVKDHGSRADSGSHKRGGEYWRRWRQKRHKRRPENGNASGLRRRTGHTHANRYQTK